MFRKVLTALGALLGVFHAVLFVSQLLQGRLTDFTTISQWLFAFVLLGAFLHLRRQRVSLLWGRQATVVWLLAAMLHAPAVAERVAPGSDWALADIAVVVVQVTAAVGAVASFLLAALALRRLWEQPSLQHPGTAHIPCARPFFDSFFLVAPRPPPAR